MDIAAQSIELMPNPTNIEFPEDLNCLKINSPQVTKGGDRRTIGLVKYPNNRFLQDYSVSEILGT